MASEPIVFRSAFRGGRGVDEATSVTVRRSGDVAEFAFTLWPTVPLGSLQRVKQQEMRIQLEARGIRLLDEGGVVFTGGKSKCVFVRVDSSDVREVSGSLFELTRESSLTPRRKVGEFRLLLPKTSPLRTPRLLTYEELLEELERHHEGTTVHMAVLMADVITPIARSAH